MSNLEPRVERIEIDMAELRLSISELRSSVSTLADLITIQQNESAEFRQLAELRFERFEQQAVQDRATLYRTFEDMRAEARLDRQRADQDRQRADQRLAEAAERANQDRALMLQLIQAISQRNGS